LIFGLEKMWCFEAFGLGKKTSFRAVVVKAGSVFVCVEEVLASLVCQVDKMYVSQWFFVIV